MPDRSSLRYCIDASPFAWGKAQTSGDRERIRAAVDRTIDLALAAEAAGIDSFWLSEDPDGWDAYAVLGAVARHTYRIRLGTGVVNPYYRHPALIAASVSTLDLLSDGRTFLGFGRGQTEWYDRALGMEIGRPLARMDESVDLLRQWWQDGLASSTDDATEFAVNGWERSIRPVQSQVPIYLAAVGPKAMHLAACIADGVIFNDLASRGFIREQIAIVKGLADDAGRDPAAIRFIARSQVVITDDPTRVFEQARATVAMIHALPGMERLLQSHAHDTDRIIADVRRAMHTDAVLASGGAFADFRREGDLDAAKAAIPTSLMHELTIAGDAELVRSRLDDLAAAGVTDVFIRPPARTARLSQLAETLEAIRSNPAQ